MALPQHIFGIHDTDGAGIIQGAGKTGWVVASLVVTDGPPDFSALANSGIGVLARLNNGYGGTGTIPNSSQYDQFAQQCANFVAGSKGVAAWIIGNEMNSGWERPGNENGQGGETITPQLYAQCFAKVRAAIKKVRPNDLVANGAPAPWNVQSGDWITYLRDILTQCIALGQKPDAIAIHTYTHGNDPATITAESHMDAPFQNYHNHFRTYRDYMAIIPAALKSVPVFITESQPADPTWWQNTNNGWVKNAFKEINDWNAVQTNQPIQALCLFRWLHNPGDPDGWNIKDRNQVQDDFRAAMQNNYRVRWTQTQPPPPPPPPDPAAKLAQEAAVVHKPWMPINDQGALYKFALKNSLGYPQTDEFEFQFGPDTYVGQVYNLGIVYVKKGDWGNCMWVKKP